MGCGISIALTSLFLDSHGYTKQNIGTLAAWFASGIVLMAIPAGALIRRISAKYTLLMCLMGYSVCVSVFPFLRSYQQIAFVRLIDGACSVGIWVSSETILLSRTQKENKANLTSLYAIWLASGYVLGPVVAKGITHFFPMRVAFVTAGIFAAAAAIYVRVRLERDEPILAKRTLDPDLAPLSSPESDAPPASAMTILWRIKNSCFATFVYGYFQASVVLFLPLYLIESKGIDRDRTIILPGLFCFGMLCFSNLVGRIADRVGHLLMMRILSFIGMLDVIGFVVIDQYILMCIAVVVTGAAVASMSPVSLALQGVVTAKRDYSRSNSIYNVFYAAGMLLGPPISSALFQHFGGKVMLLHLAVLWGAFVVFSIIFYLDDPAARRSRLATPAMLPND
jgi:MFS family permease